MVVFTFYTFVTAGVEKPVLTLANWREFLSDPYYHGFLWKTVRVATITALVCAVMGYPAAYSIAMTRFRHKWLLLLLLIVPFWISFTIRTFFLIHILGEQGAINVAPIELGLVDQPIRMLYTEGAVIMGMVHFLLPYMVLNIYAGLRGHRPQPDLGCPHPRLHQLAGLQGSLFAALLPGLLAGLLLCFKLAAGSDVILGPRATRCSAIFVFDTIRRTSSTAARQHPVDRASGCCSTAFGGL